MDVRSFRPFLAICAVMVWLVAVGMWLSGLSVETAAKWIPLRCPLLLLTGLHCPTCGLGRGLLCAVAGDWGQSWVYHPLAIPLLLTVFFGFLGVWFFPAWTGRILRRGGAILETRPVLVCVALLLYAVWGFARDLLHS